MRRMFSEKQIEGLAQEQAKAVKKDIATLVDANGNDRFIEGDITMEEITGITQTYGKWSLSGTHLLIVLVITASETATLSNSQLIANINLPDWIKEKITPVWSTVILYTQNTFRDDSWGSVSCNFTLRKESALEIRSSTNFTNSSTEKICRIAFDLLIDNE